MDPTADLYARIGRQAVRIEQQDATVANLLALFADVLSGKTDPRRILINRTERSVQVAPDGFSACLPATINGVPECTIYAPFPFPDPLPEPTEAPQG